VLAELDRILASHSFRGSPRCTAFLKYVVHKALDGESSLKERVVAEEVFGRGVQYDSERDSIVRVSALEVRRRLRQWESTRPEGGVRIRLLAGTYLPEFEWNTGEAEKNGAQLGRRARVVWAAAGLVTLGAILLGVAWPSVRQLDGHVRRFWAPITSQSGPVLICVGQVPLIRSDAEVPAGVTMVPPGPPGIVDQRLPEGTVKASTYRYSNEYVGVGGATTLFQLGILFGQWGVPAATRIVSEVSFSDLTKSPSVLVGAYSNSWTMEMTRRLKFSIVPTKGSGKIADRDAPDRFWTTRRTADGQLVEDHAIVVRIQNKFPARPMMIIAGLTSFGTGAAGEFATNNGLLRQLAATLPPDWEEKNLEVVLRVPVSQGSAGQPTAVADHIW
jgi:hypothetical protein